MFESIKRFCTRVWLHNRASKYRKMRRKLIYLHMHDKACVNIHIEQAKESLHKAANECDRIAFEMR